MSSHSYIRVEWHHESRDDPSILLSEIDSARWEIRKVEIWRDGRIGFADKETASANTRLGVGSLPSNDEIDSGPQFSLTEITQSEFEDQWADAMQFDKKDQI